MYKEHSGKKDGLVVGVCILALFVIVGFFILRDGDAQDTEPIQFKWGVKPEVQELAPEVQKSVSEVASKPQVKKVRKRRIFRRGVKVINSVAQTKKILPCRKFPLFKYTNLKVDFSEGLYGMNDAFGVKYSVINNSGSLYRAVGVRLTVYDKRGKVIAFLPRSFSDFQNNEIRDVDDSILIPVGGGKPAWVEVVWYDGYH